MLGSFTTISLRISGGLGTPDDVAAGTDLAAGAAPRLARVTKRGREGSFIRGGKLKRMCGVRERTVEIAVPTNPGTRTTRSSAASSKPTRKAQARIRLV